MTDRNDLYDFQRIISLRVDLSHRIGSWLERRGWTYSCGFPDCCWRWCKSFNGTQMTLSKEAAFKVETELLQREFIDEDVYAGDDTP